jgi:hypothetical protein
VKASIDQQLLALPKMSRTALAALWQDHFGKRPSRSLRRETIVPILAYRLQEKAYGGLKSSVAKQLRALLEGERTGNRQIAMNLRPKPGTRIVREWQDKLHEVSVLPDGYEYDGRTYRSLSEIARVITGTRWSGPAFFGTKRRATKEAA